MAEQDVVKQWQSSVLFSNGVVLYRRVTVMHSVVPFRQSAVLSSNAVVQLRLVTFSVGYA